MSPEQKQTPYQQLFPASGAAVPLFTVQNIAAVFLIMLLTSVLNFVFFWFGSSYSRQQVIMVPAVNSPDVSGVYTGDVIPKQDGDKEEHKSEIEEALEKNAEFRKIHDFLQKENPVEFNILR